MNVFEIIIGYTPFVVTGVVLSGLWAGAYILSWIVQWSWSYVDEANINHKNWVANKFNRPLPNGWVRENRYWMYYQYDETGRQIAASDGEKLPILARLSTYFGVLPLIWLGVLCLNYWYISMWLALAYGIAVTARMTRRGQKTLVKHINDVKAHQPKDVATSSETSGY